MQNTMLSPPLADRIPNLGETVVQNKQPTRTGVPRHSADSAHYTRTCTGELYDRAPSGHRLAATRRDTDSRAERRSGLRRQGEQRTYVPNHCTHGWRKPALARPRLAVRMCGCRTCCAREIILAVLSVCIFCRLDCSLVIPRVFRNGHSRTYAYRRLKLQPEVRQ